MDEVLKHYEQFIEDLTRLSIVDGVPREVSPNFLGPWKGSGVVVHEDDGYYYGEDD